jgi:hypothetical protein
MTIGVDLQYRTGDKVAANVLDSTPQVMGDATVTTKNIDSVLLNIGLDTMKVITTLWCRPRSSGRENSLLWTWTPSCWTGDTKVAANVIGSTTLCFANIIKGSHQNFASILHNFLRLFKQIWGLNNQYKQKILYCNSNVKGNNCKQ